MAGRAKKERDTYHHGNLREGLIEAALELIEQEGIDRLSLREVARRAKVSHAAPYHHFADRAALLAAVAEAGFASMRKGMLARMSGVGDPRSELRESGIAYVLFAESNPAHFRVMFSAELSDKTAYPGLAREARSTFELLLGVIERGQQAGVIRDGEPRALSLAAWSIVHGLGMLLLEGLVREDEGSEVVQAEGVARMVTRMLWEGLGK